MDMEYIKLLHPSDIDLVCRVVLTVEMTWNDTCQMGWIETRDGKLLNIEGNLEARCILLFHCPRRRHGPNLQIPDRGVQNRRLRVIRRGAASVLEYFDFQEAGRFAGLGS